MPSRSTILFIVSILLSAKVNFAEDSFASRVEQIANFFNKSLSPALAKRIKSGKFDGPKLYAGPEYLYRELLIIRAVRRDYTSALKGYLDAKINGSNIFDREECYIRLGYAALRLSQELQGFMEVVDLMGLELDQKDQATREAIEEYADAKGGDLKLILANPKWLGLSVEDLSKANQSAQTTGELLEKSLLALLKQIRDTNPKVDFNKALR